MKQVVHAHRPEEFGFRIKKDRHFALWVFDQPGQRKWEVQSPEERGGMAQYTIRPPSQRGGEIEILSVRDYSEKAFIHGQWDELSKARTKGHYRTLASGKRIWVEGHQRKGTAKGEEPKKGKAKAGPPAAPKVKGVYSISRPGPNQTVVSLNAEGENVSVLFSYETPVEATMGGKVYVSEQKHSPTTSRHVRAWIGGRKVEEVETPQSWFDKLPGGGVFKAKQSGKNQTEIHLGAETTILYSYDTPVAAHHEGKWYRTDERHSNTTSKHVRGWLDNRFEGSEEVPESFFSSILGGTEKGQEAGDLVKAEGLTEAAAAFFFANSRIGAHWIGSPDEEVVKSRRRGHYRTLPSGERVWVKEAQIRGRGRRTFDPPHEQETVWRTTESYLEVATGRDLAQFPPDELWVVGSEPTQYNNRAGLLGMAGADPGDYGSVAVAHIPGTGHIAALWGAKEGEIGPDTPLELLLPRKASGKDSGVTREGVGGYGEAKREELSGFSYPKYDAWAAAALEVVRDEIPEAQMDDIDSPFYTEMMDDGDAWVHMGETSPWVVENAAEPFMDADVAGGAESGPKRRQVHPSMAEGWKATREHWGHVQAVEDIPPEAVLLTNSQDVNESLEYIGGDYTADDYSTVFVLLDESGADYEAVWGIEGGSMVPYDTSGVDLLYPLHEGDYEIAQG
jgi:hypothetical protein